MTIDVMRDGSGFLVRHLAESGEILAEIRFALKAEAEDFARDWRDWLGDLGRRAGSAA
ncbi:hypothetical protein [Mangrovicoccus algicola]|uniref:Uncharacterized protein n=1 Tax=Mangrovicoccus algicola TaxID=2771008 RepID=A0A8J6Z1Y8_9RHOB|nr:hypothetical protein [Mangrovicoccus algicola]MBE3640208.1 hypothetical protein [Mangrovicoccus algicola]